MSTVLQCASCGTTVNAGAMGCPSCGANPRTGEGRILTGQSTSSTAPKVSGFDLGAWALGVTLAGLAVSILLPFVSPAFGALGGLLMISGLIMGIIALVARQPGWSRGYGVGAIIAFVVPLSIGITLYVMLG